MLNFHCSVCYVQSLENKQSSSTVSRGFLLLFWCRVGGFCFLLLVVVVLGFVLFFVRRVGRYFFFLHAFFLIYLFGDTRNRPGLT